MSEVQLEFYFPDNRACDLTNKAESILDLLVDCKVIVDDKWQVIPRVFLDSAGVDMDNPRVIIHIKEMNWVLKKIGRIVKWLTE